MGHALPLWTISFSPATSAAGHIRGVTVLRNQHGGQIRSDIPRVLHMQPLAMGQSESLIPSAARQLLRRAFSGHILRLCQLFIEPVTDVSIRKQILGIMRIVFNLLA